MANFENPFADPSVKDASKPLYPAQDEDFNPFAKQQPWPSASDTPNAGVPWTGVPPPQPAVPAETSSAPPPPPTYTSWENSPAADDLRRRQEELERKAEELQRREQEIQRNMQFQGGSQSCGNGW